MKKTLIAFAVAAAFASAASAASFKAGTYTATAPGIHGDVTVEVTFTADKLADRWLAEDERQFQLLWKNYFRALAIPQRINERQQRRMMPRRYWKHLTEME